MYISSAWDIIDLLGLISEINVQESTTMSYFTLAIFSWSLFQFSFNIVSSSKAKIYEDIEYGRGGDPLNGHIDRHNDNEYDDDSTSGGDSTMESSEMDTMASRPPNGRRLSQILGSLTSREMEKSTRKLMRKKMMMQQQRTSSSGKKRRPNKLVWWFTLSVEWLKQVDSEIWSILKTLIFQDGPFLVLRLTAVIKFKVRTFVTM